MSFCIFFEKKNRFLQFQITEFIKVIKIINNSLFDFCSLEFQELVVKRQKYFFRNREKFLTQRFFQSAFYNLFYLAACQSLAKTRTHQASAIINNLACV